MDCAGHCGCIRLPNTAVARLQLIVSFANETAVSERAAAAEWARNTLDGMSLKARCRLLVAAIFIHMDSLMTATMSTKQTRVDIVGMRRIIDDEDAFFAAIGNAPGILRLRTFASTTEQRTIVGYVQSAVVTGADDTEVSCAPWADGGNVLHWAASNGEEESVKWLLIAPGIDTSAQDKDDMTPLHCTTRHILGTFIRAVAARCVCGEPLAISAQGVAALAGLDATLWNEISDDEENDAARVAVEAAERVLVDPALAGFLGGVDARPPGRARDDPVLTDRVDGFAGAASRTATLKTPPSSPKTTSSSQVMTPSHVIVDAPNMTRRRRW